MLLPRDPHRHRPWGEGSRQSGHQVTRLSWPLATWLQLWGLIIRSKNQRKDLGSPKPGIRPGSSCLSRCPAQGAGARSQTAPPALWEVLSLCPQSADNFWKGKDLFPSGVSPTPNPPPGPAATAQLVSSQLQAWEFGNLIQTRRDRVL